MIRMSVVGLVAVAGVGVTIVAGLVSPWWLFLAVPLLAAAGLGGFDLTQRGHSVLRNYPLLGHARYAMEAIRPELHQYFVESNTGGTPYDRDTRNVVYRRAKGIEGATPFGTERDVYAQGYESFVHSLVPVAKPEAPPRARVGGPDCRAPYDMALLNVSAMSFGSLSANAILALNEGARRGGFAHDSGEGGLSEYHLRPGGDLIWEIGTGYFGARTERGDFDETKFKDRAAADAVKCVSLKLSQGAKPGVGGVLPGAKVGAEIAAVRGVEQGRTVISPPYHRVFHTPRELVLFIAKMRELAGGKPTGFKLCLGSRQQFLAVCKATSAEGVTPDFIVVDGSEGGTGAAPLEYVDHVGTPLTDGLVTVHNALVGMGLREKIKIGAGGKVATGADMVKRLIQGADYTNAARTMMFAVGCIQAQKCHTNRCPVGVATQDPRRSRALDVADKAERVHLYQHATVDSCLRIMSSMGVARPDELRPHMLSRRVDATRVRSYAQLYDWLEPGQLLADPPAGWAADYLTADPDRFTA
jgi:glutamate synthase domain-containing protein 2